MCYRLFACALILTAPNVGGGAAGRADAVERAAPGNVPSGYVLRITGSDETVAFSGACWVRQEDQSELLVSVVGNVPYVRELPGYALRCDISQVTPAGSMTVEIFSKRGGNRTRSRTQGTDSRVRVQMR